MHINTEKSAESYNKNAHSYEQRWKSYLDHTHRCFLEELDTNVSDIILDASCGTGLLAQQLINKDYPFKKLVLNDIADEMQQKARERLDGIPAVSFTQQPVQSLEFETESCSKILCLNAFHNYRTQKKVIQNFWKALQPGGKLYLLDWNRSGWFRPVNWMIDLWTSEHIDSRSLAEISRLLSQNRFDLLLRKEWYFQYWKFYVVVARKSSTSPS